MSYSKTTWQNLPNTTTPVNATRMNNIENGIANADGAIGVNAYSNSSTYAIGDYCIYNNKLYKCKVAITAGETFTSSKWEQTNIIDEIETVEDKSALTVSGEGDSIILNGTSKNAFKKFVVKGNTYQEANPTTANPKTIHNVTGTIKNFINSRNLLDVFNWTAANCTVNSDGSVKSNINNTYFCALNTTELNDFLFANKGKKITFSIKQAVANRVVSIVITGTRPSSSVQEGTSSGRKITMTIANDFSAITKLEVRFNRSNTAYTDTTTKIEELQLELNNDATPYSAYGGMQNLPFTFSSGQALMQGGMLTDSGVYNKNIKVTLTGTETWYTTGVTENTALHYFTLTETAKTDWIKCTICHYDNLIFSSDIVGAYINTSNNRFLIRDTHLTNSDWKTYLAEQYDNGTPVIVEYELSTPTTTAYTSIQQAQYNAIKNAISYDEQTIISNTSSDFPANIEAIAYKNISSDNYVTQEIPIGTWQGKTLYRKVIDFGALPNTSQKTVAHNISDIDIITNIHGIARAPSSPYNTFPIPFSSLSDINTNIRITANATQISISTGSNRSSLTQCYVTLEYTKTTD